MASTTDLPSTQALVSRLKRELGVCLPRGRSRHAKLYVFNHRPIICEESRFGDSWNIVPITVISVQDAGFAKAPYSKSMQKNKLSLAKPLAEVHGDNLRLYSFIKMPMAKGDRVDDASVDVAPGNVFTLFMDQNKFRQMMMVTDKSTHLLPTGGEPVIPAFSLLEIEVAPKNHQSASEKMSMVNVQTIRRVDINTTLQSALTPLTRLPGSLADAHQRAAKHACDNTLMARDLENNCVAFFVEKVHHEAVIELVEIKGEEFVRLSAWGVDNDGAVVEAVDFARNDVERCVNAASIDHALNLLSVALAIGAVSFVAVHDPFWERGGGAQQRGLMFVAPRKLLECIPDDVDTWPDDSVFDTGCDYDNGDGPQRIELKISDTQEFALQENDQHLCTPDFPFCMPGVACSRGFTCNFNLRANDKAPAEPDVARFSCNADVVQRASANAGSACVVGAKRKLKSMEWA